MQVVSGGGSARYALRAFTYILFTYYLLAVISRCLDIQGNFSGVKLVLSAEERANWRLKVFMSRLIQLGVVENA